MITCQALALTLALALALTLALTLPLALALSPALLFELRRQLLHDRHQLVPRVQ